MIADYQNENNPIDREQREELSLQERYDLLESDYNNLARRFKTLRNWDLELKTEVSLIWDLVNRPDSKCGICTIIKNKLEKFNL